MRKTIIGAIVIGVMSVLPYIRMTYGQLLPEKTTTDKLSQLASDFCSQLSRAQTLEQMTNGELSQLARDFCSQLSRAQTSSEPIRVALVKTSGEPISLAQASGQAAEKTFQISDDLSLSVGYRLWLAEWQTWTICFINICGASSAFRPASLPSAALRYKDFFASLGFLFAPEFDFGSSFLFDASARRWERDFNLGYYLLPGLAVTVGYKGVHQNFDGAKFDFNGPIAGLVINAPLGSGFSVYANGAGGYLWLDAPTCDACRNATYGTIDAGLAYKIPNWPLSLTAGYRFQYVGTHFKGSVARQTGNDFTKGAILGISWAIF